MYSIDVVHLRETCVSLEKGKTYKAVGFDPTLKSIAVIDESNETYMYPPSAFKIIADYKKLPLLDNRIT
ncbi:hypothetical protein M2139_002017 [Enterococcus sp. PF1-24]|uniref:hypothetical protein n=1 Tax=unclassified Enterococcus TaxID=2608891 RepID=UPI002472ED1A|nr:MULTISPECIES: hypothetical protein [unclassified Enterococcus]MDH6365016.1 hypothetical protein [Enterococcus sp. PFB1-1]MDH6402117.1 hypothetical protein [Enterococcus sp. PF1-24]